jgi:biopolymer transport protein ExbB
MYLLSVLLQVANENLVEITQQTSIEGESYFQILLKGGWILLPIFLLFFLSIYVIIERWVTIKNLGKKEPVWFARVNELISENKLGKAAKFCAEHPSSYAKIIAAGLNDVSDGEEAMQESMQTEARQQISKLENRMNYLGISASIAPMLGFLGTIFGVIRIFYNIALTNDLNIASISDGLYQKMICSGVGLFVGIVAYSGYYILNGYLDKIVANMDKYSNDTLRAVRQAKVSKAEKSEGLDD